MKKRLHIYLNYFIIWLSFFVVARTLFMIYNISQSAELSTSDIIGSYIYGLKLDLSVTGYIMFFTSIFFLITTLLKGKILRYIMYSFSVLALLYAAGIVAADCELYRNWGFRMDSTPLLYLKTPGEAMASAEWYILVIGFATYAILFLGTLFFMNRMVFRPLKDSEPIHWSAMPVFLFLAAFMFLPIRGGVGLAPINTGSVYFSDNQFANHAAINVVWNVNHSLLKRNKINKQYKFMDDTVADSIANNIDIKSNLEQYVIKTEDPNVVVIILESFTSKLIGALGGEDSVTPELNKIAKNGVLFNNMFASGDRSDKGIVALLSGYPAQPTTSVIKFPKKTQSLPSLAKEFTERNYSTAYYYGGDVDFANMRSYVKSSGFRDVISMDDFSEDTYNAKWGVHDHIMFNRFLDDINNDKGKFFKVFFTLSSHEPFDVPATPIFPNDTEENKFRNSVHYTDSCIGDFIAKAKQTDWWDNTLIVFVADHGMRHPYNSPVHHPDKFKIPMIWTGGAVNNSVAITKVGSQVDFPTTLLNQLKWSSDRFIFGNDLLCKGNGHAIYSYNDGFGYIDKKGMLVYDNVGKRNLVEQGKTEQLENRGKALLQIYNRDFLKR